MADNLQITEGAGTYVGTDDISGIHYQYVKLADGTLNSAAAIKGSVARGLYVDPHNTMVRLSATPTISTSQYTAKDAIGGLMTFSNSVRASGGSGIVLGVQVIDKDQEKSDVDLLLFDRSITAPTDNAAFDPSDAELANCVGFVRVVAADYSDLNDNSIASVETNLPFVSNGTDLFGVLVARATPTFTATSDIVVVLTIRQD